MMLWNRGPKSALEDTGGDGVDEHAVWAHFMGQAARQAFERALAGGVMNRPGDRARAGDGTDVDDAPVLLSNHAAHGGAAHAEGCEQVKLQEVCELLVVQET